MRIPHKQLSSAAVRAIVEEFVTRDGTDYSPVEQRINQVLEQLEAGRVEIHFDDETKTGNIVAIESDAFRPSDDVNGRRQL